MSYWAQVHRERRLGDTTTPAIPSAKRRERRLPLVFAMALCTVYCALFLVRAQPSWPALLRDAMNGASSAVYRFNAHLLALAGVESPDPALRGYAYLALTAGGLPWLAMLVLGRGRPSDTGFRLPNRYGWRLSVVGFLIALPFLGWMIRGAEFAGPYLAHLERAGATAFIAYYLINMLTEHFLLHGVVLTACRADRRWPTSRQTLPASAGGRAAVLCWLGFAQSSGGATGLRRLTRWLGLPDGCVPAIATSAALFGLVHIGKDARELLLSIPGGLAFAVLAYRTDSWLTVFLLHVATAGTALSIIIVMK